MRVNYILHGFCAPQNCPLPAVKATLQVKSDHVQEQSRRNSHPWNPSFSHHKKCLLGHPWGSVAWVVGTFRCFDNEVCLLSVIQHKRGRKWAERRKKKKKKSKGIRKWELTVSSSAKSSYSPTASPHPPWWCERTAHLYNSSSSRGESVENNSSSQVMGAAVVILDNTPCSDYPLARGSRLLVSGWRHATRPPRRSTQMQRSCAQAWSTRMVGSTAQQRCSGWGQLVLEHVVTGGYRRSGVSVEAQRNGEQG